MNLHRGDLKGWVVTEHGDDSVHRVYAFNYETRKSEYRMQPRAPYDRVRGSYTSFENAKKGLSQSIPLRSTQAPEDGLTSCIWELDFRAGEMTLVYIRTSADTKVLP